MQIITRKKCATCIGDKGYLSNNLTFSVYPSESALNIILPLCVCMQKKYYHIHIYGRTLYNKLHFIYFLPTTVWHDITVRHGTILNINEMLTITDKLKKRQFKDWCVCIFFFLPILMEVGIGTKKLRMITGRKKEKKKDLDLATYGRLHRRGRRAFCSAAW